MYKTIDEIKRANERANGCWFDDGAMRFFGSRVLSDVYPVADGAYFVTSEKRPRSDDPRRYSVRFCNAKGSIDTVGEFQAHATAAQARSAAKRAAASGKGPE